MFGIEHVTDFIASNPKDILIWSHGFFVALALRRGRIKMILDAVTSPVKGDGK
jgi:hypothetical protein